MDELQQMKQVPFIVYDDIVVRLDRIIKRLMIAVVISILVIFVSNALWLYAWMQYDYSSTESQTVTVDGKDGVANYIGNDGEINNGESDSAKSKNKGENTGEGE